MIKVGDRVKVVRKTSAPIGWIDDMEATMGVEGEVVDKTGSGALVVKFSDLRKSYLYNEEALELATEKSKQPYQMQSELLNTIINNHKREIEKLEDMLVCIKSMEKYQVKIIFEEEFKI